LVINLNIPPEPDVSGDNENPPADEKDHGGEQKEEGKLADHRLSIWWAQHKN
jgi:hypothetical protein